jgi:hypothetical protein
MIVAIGYDIVAHDVKNAWMRIPPAVHGGGRDPTVWITHKQRTDMNVYPQNTQNHADWELEAKIGSGSFFRFCVILRVLRAALPSCGPWLGGTFDFVRLAVARRALLASCATRDAWSSRIQGQKVRLVPLKAG